MSYMGYPCTFEPMKEAIGVVRDPQDVESSHDLLLGVKQMLAERFREETDGGAKGPFRTDFARDRIRGLLHGVDGKKGLLRIRDIATAQGACPDFVEAVDLVIAAAKAAMAAAPERLKLEEKAKPDAHHADWTRAKVPNPEMAEPVIDISDFIK